MNDQGYISIVESMFSKNGALVRAGGRHNEQQGQYAIHIANAINSNHATALCEANTGIGKSIAYLIPALVYLAMNKDSLPIVVSTHTRALQRQLIEKDIVLASVALDCQGLKLPNIAFRMGRQAFFSPTRVQELIEDMDKALVSAEHTDLVRFANASAVSGTGLWMDYINKYGLFPQGVRSEDICLLDLMESDNPAYDIHLLQAKTADLLITNHATLISPAVFKETQFHAVICDEAHEIESVCKSLGTHKSQLKRIANAIVDTASSSQTNLKTIALANDIENRIKDFDLKNLSNESLISDINNAKIMSELEPDVIALNKLIIKARKAYIKNIDDAPSAKQAAVAERLEKHIETLTSFERGAVKSRRRAIGFSEIQRDPSIATVSLNAGALFSYRANLLTKRVVLVSATISNANARTLSFTHLMGALNIKEGKVTDTCSISPTEFGEMSFIKVPYGKSPIISQGGDYSFDASWIKKTVAMIDQAALTGKTLVLSPSMKESRMLSEQIKSSYLLQDTNNTLMQLTRQFTVGHENVLLSAGAWNGVSFRNTNGDQLLQNIVITRIPFIPIDKEQQYLQTEWMTEKGFTENQINAIFWTSQQYSAMLKLKQGIGRGLRSPTDKIKIWFADPRMPTQTRSSGLIAAIPHRFLEGYFNADIFDGVNIQDAVPFHFI